MRRRWALRKTERGLTTVEFSIVGSLLFVVLFAIIEFGRTMYVITVLTEATRRGARLAAVCPVNDPYPAQGAVFAYGGSSSPVVADLTTSNVVIEYLDGNGNVISSPSPDFADTAANFDAIRYVRAQIVNFSMQLMIPFFDPTLSLSGFAATIPRESLGVPRTWPANSPLPPC